MPANLAVVEGDDPAAREAAAARCAGYLAALLRDVDPADRPGALDQAHAAATAREQYRRAVAHGRDCPHGKRAGNLPHPTHGQPTCPLCRRGGG